MKDYEILLFLAKLKPENETQAKAIDAMDRAFRRVTENEILDEGVEDFLDMFSREELINVPSGEFYDEYFNFCEDFDYIPVSQNMLTRITKAKFNLAVRPVLINNKATRVFKN